MGQPAGRAGSGTMPLALRWTGRIDIFVYNRSAHPIIVLDTDGNMINHWGEGLFGSAHHIAAGPDGSLYTTDIGDHTVRKWTAEGELLMMLGTPNDPPEMFRRRAVQQADGHCGCGGRFVVHFRRLWQRADSPFHGDGRADKVVGASRARVRGSSASHTPSASVPKVLSMWCGQGE